MMTTTHSRILMAALALLLALPGSARAREGDGVDAKAMKSIENLGDFLARTKEVTVTIDVVREWGQKLEFGETRTLTLRRPDRFKVDGSNWYQPVYDNGQVAYQVVNPPL
jgi:hypothetical protein